MRIGLYPGTFDPITLGHVDIIERAAPLFDRLMIGVAVSAAKAPLLPLTDRLELARLETRQIEAASATPIEVRAMTGLMVDFARACGARMVVRGLRGTADFDYEYQMAGMNRALAPGLDTVFLMASPGRHYISSSLVRQVAQLGGDFSAFVPPATMARLRACLHTGGGRVKEPPPTEIPNQDSRRDAEGVADHDV